METEIIGTQPSKKRTVVSVEPILPEPPVAAKRGRKPKSEIPAKPVEQPKPVFARSVIHQ